MRRLTAILLVCALALSQYGRFLGYVKCQVGNLVNPQSNTHCDCEQQSPAPGSDAKDLPLVKNTTITLDEYDVPSAAWAISALSVLPSNASASRASGYTSLFIGSIFHPPKA